MSTYQSPFTLQGEQDLIDHDTSRRQMLRKAPTFFDAAQAAYQQMPVTMIEDAFGSPTWQPDPAWTRETHQKFLDDHYKEIPEKYHSSLFGALNEKHAYWLLERAKRFAKNEETIAELGLPGLAVDIGAQIVDPINLLSGAFTVKVIDRMVRSQALWRRMAAHGAGQGTLAFGSMAAAEKGGMAYDVNEYLMGTSLGIVLGGAFGDLAAKASSKVGARNLNALLKSGRDLADEAITLKSPYADPPTLSTEAVRDAVDSVTQPRVAERAAFAEPRRAEPIPETMSDDVPYIIQEMEPTPAYLKASRYISHYEGPDGAEYRIMFQTDDMTGPVRLQRFANGKLEDVERDLDDIQSAVAALQRRFPDAEIAPAGAKRTTPVDPEPVAPTPLKAAEVAEGPLSKIGLGAREQDLLTKLPAAKMTGKRMHQWLVDNGIKPKGGTREEMAEQVADAIVPGRAADATNNAAEAVERNRIRAAIEKRLLTGELEDLPMPTIKDAPVESSPAVVPEKAAAAPADAGAAANPAAANRQLQDPNWLGVKDEHAPMTAFQTIRRDAAARLSSMVPQIRIVSNYLLNDVVGKVGHQLNRWSTDLEQQMTLDRWLTRWDGVRSQAYYEWVNTNPRGRIYGLRNAREFNVAVSRYVKNPNAIDSDYHPAVVKLGKETSRLMDEILGDLKDPGKALGLPGSFNPVQAADEIEFNRNYLWRHIDDVKFNAMYERYGESQIYKLVEAAIVKAQPDIDPAYLARLARAYVNNINKRAARLGDDMTLALGEGRRAHLAIMLREDGQFSDEEIDFLMRRLFKNETKGDNMHTQRRVLLDEGVSIDAVDKFGNPAGKLHFRDMLNEDVVHLVTAYARRMSGRAALARTRIRLPSTKDIKTRVEMVNGQQRIVQSEVDRPGIELIDGIESLEKKDEILMRMREAAADYHRANPNKYTMEMLEEEIKEMEYAFNRILGYPDPVQGEPLARGIRILKRFNATRLMNNVGIAQLQEFGGAIGTFGVRAALTHLPAFRRIVNGVDGSVQYLNRLGREIEAMGIGVEATGGFRWANPWNADDVPYQLPAPGAMRVADEFSKKAEDLTYAMSGMNVIRRKQEMAVAAMFIQKMGDFAKGVQAGKKISAGWVRRFRQLGLNEDEIKSITQQMATKATFDDSLFYSGGKIARMNLASWDDQAAAKAFERAIYRFTKKTIQDRTLGNEWKFMRNPLLSVVFQFRSFMFQAWTNHTLHNIHMRDPTMVANFAWSVTWAAAIRALQVHAVALGRSDADEFKEKELDPMRLGAVGFQRAAWASIMPSVVDTGLSMWGQGGIFDARNSGTASSFFDNPTLGLGRAVSRGLGGIANSLIDGREMTQPEVRSLISMFPWSNGMAVAIPLNGLISDLPERAPRPKNRFWED